MRKNINNFKKVVVAMSGGVDSSVTAFLLLEKGFQVIGATIQTGFSHEINQVKKICDQLRIQHYLIDARELFEEKIICPFNFYYNQAKTPNPCIDCNVLIKFPLINKLRNKLKADYFATGHYAQIFNIDGRYLISKAKARDKDQSYFLYKLSQDLLQYCIFPLGEYSKTSVRNIAIKNKLLCANQKDSFDICFVKNDNYRIYLDHNFLSDAVPGEFVDTAGNTLGKHQGIRNYTIGQRRGLNLAFGYPVYVLSLDYKKNIVVIGKKEELYSNQIQVKNLNFIPFDRLTEAVSASVQIRYRMKPVPAKIIPFSNGMNGANIIFDQKIWAATPGQSAVFYWEDMLLGGGCIL